MFRDDYRKELDRLLLDEDFKQKTILLMSEKNNGFSKENGKFLSFAKKSHKKYRNIAAAAIAVAVSAAMFIFYSSRDVFVTSDSAISEDMSIPSEEILQKDKEFDFLPDNGSIKRVYTIDDAISSPVLSGSPLKHSDRIQFNTETEGGMGFEGVMYYDISQLDTKNIFSPDVTAETLPLYKFTPLDAESLKKEYMSIIKATDADADSIISVEYEWAQMGTHNELPVIMETVKTSSDTPPEGFTEIYRTAVEYEKGYIDIFPSRGQISLYLYDKLPANIDDYGIGVYTSDKYSHILGDNLDSYVMNDYNIYGQQDYNLTYIYRKSSDFSQQIFNSSAGSIATWHLDDLIYAKNNIGECLHFLYTSPSCYEKTENLPAIDWQQALDMLYKGEYISSVHEKITDNTVIGKIELVYKEPPCYLPGLLKKGYAVPFYKFYAELPQYNRDTENGVLKQYGIYYVCAIAPGYIEFTDSYTQFN